MRKITNEEAIVAIMRLLKDKDDLVNQHDDEYLSVVCGYYIDYALGYLDMDYNDIDIAIVRGMLL